MGGLDRRSPMASGKGWEFLLPLLPEKLRPYAKAVMAALPAFVYLLTVLSNEIAEMGLVVPDWLALVVAALTAVAVYEVPNGSARGDE